MTFMYIVKLAWGIEKHGEAEIIYNYTYHMTQAKILKEVKDKEMIECIKSAHLCQRP